VYRPGAEAEAEAQYWLGGFVCALVRRSSKRPAVPVFPDRL
jgi:hypothetical protein